VAMGPRFNAGGGWDSVRVGVNCVDEGGEGRCDWNSGEGRGEGRMLVSGSQDEMEGRGPPV
jgi:hypothetical protein